MEQCEILEKEYGNVTKENLAVMVDKKEKIERRNFYIFQNGIELSYAFVFDSHYTINKEKTILKINDTTLREYKSKPQISYWDKLQEKITGKKKLHIK